jgi:succinate--hydroxymethylglutarate CoA-transferase
MRQPTCTQILGDLGYAYSPYQFRVAANKIFSAEIIKIEHPTRGDDTRAWGPPDLAYTDGVERSFPGESAYYLSVRMLKTLAYFLANI